MPQSIGAGNMYNYKRNNHFHKESLMHTKELTGLAADLLGLAAVCKEFRRLSSSAVEPLELKSAVNCCQQVTLTRPFSLIHL